MILAQLTKKILRLLFLSILVLIYSCTNKEKCKIITKYPDNSIKEKICYDDADSGKYRVISLYENGMPKDTFYYNADTITKAVSYEPNGVYCVVNFIDDKPSGLKKCYFDNDTLHSIGSLYEGNQIGEWKFYYLNGNIKSYEYFADSGKRVFLRKYTIDGEVEKSMGSGIAYIYSKDDTVLTKGQSYNAAIFLVNPPDCNVNLDLARLDENLNIVKKTKAKIDNGVAYVNFNSTEVKTHKIGYVWELRTLQGIPVDKGIFVQNFIVK